MKRNLLSLLAAFTVLASAAVASASVQFDLDKEYNFDNTAYPPSPDAPWARVEIYDSVDALTDASLATYGLTSKDVLVVISSLVKNASESIEAVAFNFDLTDVKDGVGGLKQFNDYQVMLKQGTFQDPTLSYRATIDGSQMFDLKFNFNFTDPGKFFDGTDKYYVKLKYDSNIRATDFDGKNADGFYAAAHVVGVPVSVDNPTGQSFVMKNNGDLPSGGPVPPVPEPATLAIWGLGLGIAGLVRLRRKTAA